MRSPIYNDDLAFIHIDGFGFHWERAAPAILKWLRDAGIRSGTVVDLGCGGGQWLARLAAEGYQPVGVDASPAMIRAARKLVPPATLITGSFADVDLPSCDAVTSLGEPLNYLNDRRGFERTLRNVYHALRPGGLFIFDVREPPTKPVETRVFARVGDDWACISFIDEQPPASSRKGADGGRIVRRITSFRRHGAAYRRSEEVHDLETYPKKMMLEWLRQLGFRARTYRGYGDYRLAPRQVVFVARK
jgi:SAM-dependent methyltransferase